MNQINIPNELPIYLLPLTNSTSTVFVDKEDYENLIGLSWHTKKTGLSTYVACSKRYGHFVRTIYLHRYIMDENRPAVDIHHKNGNTFDCRRCNLERRYDRPHHKEL